MASIVPRLLGGCRRSLQGDSAKAHAAFIVAHREVEKTLENQPDFAAALSLLGMIDAGWAEGGGTPRGPPCVRIATHFRGCHRRRGLRR